MVFHKFAVNTSGIKSNGFSPAYVLFDYDPMLPLEHVVGDIIDCQFQSVADLVSTMTVTVDLVLAAMNRVPN